MWKREDLMNLPEKERIEKTKTIERHYLPTQKEVDLIWEAGLQKYICTVGNETFVDLYPEEWEQVKLPF